MVPTLIERSKSHLPGCKKKKKSWNHPMTTPLSFLPSLLKGLLKGEGLRWIISQRFICLLGCCQRTLQGGCALICMSSSFYDPSQRDMPFLWQRGKKTWLKFAMTLNISAWSWPKSLPLLFHQLNQVICPHLMLVIYFLIALKTKKIRHAMMRR